uniref:(northern house mosquito) hypothetical protein n=1 Tax=Culex pipiens TaxID=7175 RepID=A0A8D8GBR4_CULPI
MQLVIQNSGTPAPGHKKSAATKTTQSSSAKTVPAAKCASDNCAFPTQIDASLVPSTFHRSTSVAGTGTCRICGVILGQKRTRTSDSSNGKQIGILLPFLFFVVVVVVGFAFD